MESRKPCLILPGFMSTGLVVAESKTNPRWNGRRVWLSLSKLGFTGKMLGSTTQVETNDERACNITLRNDWVTHMTLQPDLLTEREGIQVRAMEGLAGVDFLDPGAFTGLASWVFGPVIKLLRKQGYKDGFDLDAAGYDWRVPPQVLEERDKYFTRTMARIERMVSDTGKRVVLLCHSMGCSCGQYLLHFAKQNKGDSWIEAHVETLFLVGAPHRGSAQALRGLIVGSNMGLPSAFLSSRAALIMGRSFGSTPWLLPVGPDGKIEKEDSKEPLGAPFIKQEGKLKVSLRLVDVMHLSSVGINLGQLRISLRLGDRRVLSKWFEPNRLGPVHVLNSKGTDCVVFEIPAPAKLSTENDVLTIKLIEQRVTTKRMLNTILDRSPELHTGGFFRKTMRTVYKHTIGKAESVARGSTIASSAISLARTLSSTYVDGTTLELDVNLTPHSGRWNKTPHRLEAHAMVRLHVAYHSEEALHCHTGVKAPVSCTHATQGFSICTPYDAIKLEGLDATRQLWESTFYQLDPLLNPAAPPPIRNVVAVYGINVPTEVHCALKRSMLSTDNGYMQNVFEVDTKAKVDPLFLVKRGYKCQEGIVSETSKTPHISLKDGSTVLRSGDGVVPYASLQQVYAWKHQCDVTVHELEGVLHRGILDSPAFHEILVRYLVPDGKVQLLSAENLIAQSAPTLAIPLQPPPPPPRTVSLHARPKDIDFLAFLGSSHTTVVTQHPPSLITDNSEIYASTSRTASQSDADHSESEIDSDYDSTGCAREEEEDEGDAALASLLDNSCNVTEKQMPLPYPTDSQPLSVPPPPPPRLESGASPPPLPPKPRPKPDAHLSHTE